MNFFQVTIKNMTCNMDLLTKKLDEIKINKDVFLGNYLTFEQRFLNKLLEKTEQEIEQEKIEEEKIECEVSHYLHKKSMGICCETSIVTETIAKKVIYIWRCNKQLTG